MEDRLGSVGEMIDILSKTVDRRYVFSFDQVRQLALFTRSAMQARAELIGNGQIRITYESALHEVTEEICSTAAQAAKLIDDIMTRKQLCRVRTPDIGTA